MKSIKSNHIEMNLKKLSKSKADPFQKRMVGVLVREMKLDEQLRKADKKYKVMFKPKEDPFQKRMVDVLGKEMSLKRNLRGADKKYNKLDKIMFVKDGWVRNPKTNRLIKVFGPTYDKLYPFEKTLFEAKKTSTEFDKQTKMINKRYDELMSKTDIRDYPMIDTTLGDLRKDEVRFSLNKKKAKMSFVDLFESRIDEMETETVSIILNVRIDTSDAKPTNEEMKEYSKNLEDEYDVQKI